jgi:hypothetical protein
MQLSYNTRILKNSFKILPILLLAYILYDLFKNDKLLFSFEFLNAQQLTPLRWALLIPVILLMGVNWTVEARKWQLLTQEYFPLGIVRSFIAVLSGISTALFTPNRVGDFIGRVSHLPKKHRKNGMISSFFGSYSQWLLTIIMGWIAWIQLGTQFVDSIFIYQIISVAYFLVIITLVFFFLTNGFRLKIFNSFQKYFQHPPSNTIRLKLIGLSLLRYFIFTSQFYILLQMFGVDLSYGIVLSKLGLFYLFTSLIPSTFWGEIGIKESLAVWVFSGLIVNSLLIITTTLLLWFINLLVPAIIGNYFLYKKARALS